SSKHCASSIPTTSTSLSIYLNIASDFLIGRAMVDVPLWVTTESSAAYRLSIAGLKTRTVKFPYVARRTLRISSSDLPENILPQITSTQPVCFITYILGALLLQIN